MAVPLSEIAESVFEAVRRHGLHTNDETLVLVRAEPQGRLDVHHIAPDLRAGTSAAAGRGRCKTWDPDLIKPGAGW
jgi:hypothetical protein